MTDLARDMDKKALEPMMGAEEGDWKTADQGAATIVVAAFDPLLNSKLIPLSS